MNVSCPECRSIFRVDPSKVPAAGIRARCSVCGGIITVGAGGSIDEEFGVGQATSRPEASELAMESRPSATPPLPAAVETQLTEMKAPPPPQATEAPTPSTSAPEFPTSRVATPAAPTPAIPAPVVTPAPPPKPVFARALTPPASAPTTTRRAPIGPASASGMAARPPIAPRPSGTGPIAVVRPSGAAPLMPPSGQRPAVAPPSVPLRPSIGAPPSGGDQAATTASATPAAPTPPRTPINPFLANDPNAKARRLSRALVSDLVTYFPQRREEGLRDGTLRELFQEEIKKSREEYVDQVGREFADSTTHFQDALNEILAAGRKIF